MNNIGKFLTEEEQNFIKKTYGDEALNLAHETLQNYYSSYKRYMSLREIMLKNIPVQDPQVLKQEAKEFGIQGNKLFDQIKSDFGYDSDLVDAPHEWIKDLPGIIKVAMKRFQQVPKDAQYQYEISI